MKELIEEKAKSFEEALSRAKGFYKRFPEYKEILEKIFPELAESEDERIRKDIISYFKTSNSIYLDAGEPISRRNVWLAWLEKQGEKKPVEENKGNNGGISPNSEWSDEDRIMIKRLEWIFTEISKGSDSFYGNNVQPIIDWLKFLRNRCLPQPKLEWTTWTTEDWNEVETIAIHLDNMENPGMAEALRKVLEKNFWKPSEAQMIVLNDIIINGHLSNANERILKGLQEQLKSL